MPMKEKEVSEAPKMELSVDEIQILEGALKCRQGWLNGQVRVFPSVEGNRTYLAVLRREQKEVFELSEKLALAKHPTE